MTPATQSATAMADVGANNPPSDADAYTYRAPRFGDLVSCPYCDADTFTRCDFCGDEGVIYADDVIGGSDAN